MQNSIKDLSGTGIIVGVEVGQSRTVSTFGTVKKVLLANGGVA